MAGRGGWPGLIRWLVAAVAPPAAVAGAWQHLVADYPLVAVFLLIVYEALVAAVSFAGEVIGELRERWRKRVADWVDQRLGRWASRFDRRYRAFLRDGLRFIDVRGLATIGYYTPELDEVFVDVSLAPRAPHDVPGDLLADVPADVTDRRRIDDFLDLAQSVVLAVVGAPGGGKTTLLRHTARQLCRVRRGRRRTVPILLYLRDHATKIVSDPDVALPELVRGTLGPYRDDEPLGWFEQRLRDGACVVLLDGLDEVARQNDRRSVADWVERQIEQYPKNDYVITSRPHGYRTAIINGATVLQVRSFTDDQVRRFVQGWYLAVERHSTGSTSEQVGWRAESATDDLLERLNRAPGLYDLAVNPLLLTMIANVHRYRGALPGSRAELYSEICQVMLWRRREAKRLPIELSGDKKEVLLRRLAFTMMERRVRDLPRADVLTEITPTLRRMSRDFTAMDFLADVGNNGLLIERESGLYSFAHQTFQEYLAATHIRDKGLASILADAVDDVWWRETTLLYAAHADADPIVRACLDAASVTAFSLAFDCAEQNSELAPELRERLDELLRSAFSRDTDPEQRRLMTAVLITRHLGTLIRTSGGARVCVRPIPASIYWLYLQDTHAPAPEGSVRIEPGRNAPITGVRGSDAAAFVHWVNRITGGEPVYRLPNRVEINDPAVHNALNALAPETTAYSAWLEPDNAQDQPALWIGPHTDHPHKIDAATLARHVNDDIARSIPTLIIRPLLLRRIPSVRVLGIARKLAPANVLELVLDLDFDRDNDQILDLARVLDLAISRNLDAALVRVLGIDLGVDRALDLEAVMGRALSHAVTHVLRQTTTTATWPAEFAQAFADEAGIATATYVVSPDLLADKVHRAHKELRELLSPPNKADPLPWGYQVASNLEESALPIFNRQHPLNSDTATALRLAALCVAAEADARQAQQLGNTFREIAAGVTLLERRATGQALPTEAIILATA